MKLPPGNVIDLFQMCHKSLIVYVIYNKNEIIDYHSSNRILEGQGEY
jgi:hypothetical protein